MEARLQDGRLEEGVAPAAPGVADVDALLAQFPGPVRLYAAKTYVRIALAALAVIEFMLVKGAVTSDHFTLIGWAALTVFSVACLSTAWTMLNRNALLLVLDGEGFTLNFTWRARRCSWQDVGDFSVWQNSRFPVATYNDRTLARHPLQRLMCKYRRSRYGRDTALPDTYGLGAEGLARLMTQWRQRSLAKQA
jgi:hypothetical protein